MDKIIVTIAGFAAILGTAWFFFGKKEEKVQVKDSVDIKVSGGYVPETIVVPKNKTTRINFLRTDKNSCLEEVVLSDFKIKKFLPLNKKVSVEIKPENKGEYDISCAMNMYHGKIIVK